MKNFQKIEKAFANDMRKKSKEHSKNKLKKFLTDNENFGIIQKLFDENEFKTVTKNLDN